ncbi:uncharacterized protein SEPMUDRAFT_68709 [Sphaerulina musiva SO2202]|uniref:Uncharacterized protein n=1 Tax=Sphaerulina musiva (strain SO2202) TaxID=692275 RepID=M3D2A1_SPHMS|nr:uncharacterized protein SEPMUDRAFT_68709 [Sphaerulina musiva SO2202]EMF11262.1 hypothetical protein SEPMUDRAFT_68709 [Sphaerulina musiva SO2202]
MKTDNYLSLCLEQAAKSPLHYRHGAIVVRGGKVIGHGHNDYRPGFNGGALKSGRIAHGGYDGAAIAELKKKLKGKQKCDKPEKQQQNQIDRSSTFVPFESTNSGGGHSVNQPLSMHSEMMAIYSALNASSAMSSTTFSREKPCFKLPCADKRKARLRRNVLEAYVKASAVLKLPHLNQVHLENKCNNSTPKEGDKGDLSAQSLANLSVAFHEDLGVQKHHQNRKNEKKKNGKKNQYQYEYQYGAYGQKQQDFAQRQPSASNPRKEYSAGTHECDMAQGSEPKINNGGVKQIKATASDFREAPRHTNPKKDYKRSGKMRLSSTAANERKPMQPVLVPTGHTHNSNIKVNDRKQDPRLRGADLYVVRIGWSSTARKKPTKPKASSELGVVDADATVVEDATYSSTSRLPGPSTTSSSSGTGSLHDELINREPSSSASRPPVSDSIDDCSFDKDKIHASRPCYRCVAFMNQVGIRRVFWTNDAGEWEGGKVAALIEAMDTGMEDAAKGGPTGNGIFVTKHEVLMLRRMMGAKAGM